MLKKSNQLRFNSAGIFMLVAFLFMGGYSAFAQIDQKSGSFKIPAVKDTAQVNNIEKPKSSNLSIEGLKTELPKSNFPLNSTLNEPLEGENATSFYMMKPKEEFADAGARYTQQMNERQVQREAAMNMPQQNDINYGEIKSKAKGIRVVCRDFGAIDGDRITIMINDVIVRNGMYLDASYNGVNLPLDKGFNKITFLAVNQGSTGPNTAQFIVYDENGNTIYNNEWNMLTGVKATVTFVKD